MKAEEKALLDLQRARTIDQQVEQIARRTNKDKIELACLLREMKERKLAVALGFDSVYSYAAARLGFGCDKTRQLLALAGSFERLPRLKEAALAGELPWTAAAAVSQVATEKDESTWIEKARTSSVRELRLEAKAAKNETPLERVSFEVTPQEKADIEEAIRVHRKENPSITRGAAMAEASRRSVAGAAFMGSTTAGEPLKLAGGPRCRITVNVCSECKKATRETAAGTISVDEASFERAACDAEKVDVREGPARVSRTMPLKVARHIDARDGGKCRVPGCRNRAFIERHHEGGYARVGHDPHKAMLLCGGHHRARHDGALRIEGDAEGELRFFLADGTPLVAKEAVSRETGPEQVSRETGPEQVSRETRHAGRALPERRSTHGVSRERPRDDCSPKHPHADDAVACLRNLQLKAAEARVLVAIASRSVDRDCSVPDLVRAALQAKPSPGGRSTG